MLSRRGESKVVGYVPTLNMSEGLEGFAKGVKPRVIRGVRAQDANALDSGGGIGPSRREAKRTRQEERCHTQDLRHAFPRMGRPR